MGLDAQGTVKSADRVLDIFELLRQHRRDLSHAEIAEYLNIPKSSLTPLLRNLVTRGYLEVSRNGRAFSLGQAFMSFAEPAPDLAARALPFLNELTRETGESSALNERRDDQVEVVASVTGPSRLVTHMRLGDLAPLYATSGGKAILAFLTTAEQEAYASRAVFTPITARTIKTGADLARQLAEIRATGFAYSHQEFTLGIVGMATALLDQQGIPIASFNIAMPAVRFDDSKRLLVQASLTKATQALRRSL